ncbi:MAG: hypothetical protein ACLR8Y_09820 [Alistipes indistinctus]
MGWIRTSSMNFPAALSSWFVLAAVTSSVCGTCCHDAPLSELSQ